jgi:hypothetical protein
MGLAKKLFKALALIGLGKLVSRLKKGRKRRR